MQNPFCNHLAAENYHLYRPRYHHIPMGMLYQFRGHSFKNVLDVACGTGHSTKALALISEKVTGLDLSEQMLEIAKKNTNVEFIKADAREFPFESSVFDLVSISMGFHWMDQDKFLKESVRVLMDDGLLAVDNFGFSGEISKNTQLQKEHQELFEKYLPRASKKAAKPSAEQLKKFNLQIVEEFSYDHELLLNQKEFIGLIQTWSNFQALSQENKEKVSHLMNSLYEKVFNLSSINLQFQGNMGLYKVNN